MKSLPALFLFSVIFVFLPFSVLELIADIQVIEEDDFVSRAGDWSQSIFANTRLVEDFHDLQIMLQSYQRLAEAYREAEDFEQAVESLERMIELAPNGTMVSETMLKLALLHWRESTDSHTGICQLVEKYPNTQEGQEASKILEDFE